MKLTELVMLARIMSQKYGVEVRIANDGKTASCSSRRSNRVGGKREFTITLPFLKDKGKFDKMIRGYLDHEIGHVLYTDFDLDDIKARKAPEYCDNYYRQVWNIFEDVYIEARMSAAFPGSKINLQWLARNIFTPEMAFDSVKEIVDGWKDGITCLRDTVYSFVMPYCLFKRRAMADPELAHSHKLFDSVRNALASIDPGVAEAMNKVDAALAQPANSSDETAELAGQVWYALHGMQLDQQQPLQQGQSGQGSGDDQQEGDSQEQPGQSGNRSGGAQDQGDSGGQEEQGSNGNSQQQSGNTQGKSNAATQEMLDAVVDAMDGAFEKKKNSAFKRRKRVPLQTEIADALSEMIADGRDGAEREQLGDGNSFRSVGNALRELERLSEVEFSSVYSRMATQTTLNKIAILQAGFMRTIPGLLQSIQFSPCRIGYTGRMSGRDLYKTGIGNGRIFQKKAERREQRVDVAILLDASGSMCMDMFEAQVTLYAMLGMLKSLPKVRSYAAIFSDKKYVVLSRFADKRMNGYSFIRADGYTPTAGAVLKVLPELSTSKDVRRILFVITDGGPDNEDAFNEALKIASSQGVEVYGIGLREGMMLMRKQFGDDNVIMADDMKELPLKLAGMMKNALVKAVAV